MAVFLRNDCKFQGCGLNFQCLGDLIYHIEEKHIDSDPKILERQETEPPSSLALSYILRFFTEAARREHVIIKAKSSTLLRTDTPTGSEVDEEEIQSEDDSDDSWTTQEEFSSDHIFGMVNMKEGMETDKPFACPVPGCKKRYKNINGIKYHARHGHRRETVTDTIVKKTYRCHCGKNYKTSNGLKNHALTHHPTTELMSLQALFPPTLVKAVLSPTPGTTAPQSTTGIIPNDSIVTLTQSPSPQSFTIPITKAITTTPSSSTDSTPIKIVPISMTTPLIKVVPPLIPTVKDIPVGTASDALTATDRRE